MTPKQRLYVRLLSIAAVVVAVDQITKQLALEYLSDGSLELVRGVLSLRLTYNSGGAFGFLQGVPTFFLIASLAIVVVILVWVGRSDEGGFVVPLGLVLGGGIGNLIDRLFRGFDGQVVDFVDLHVWPVFNVADSAIVIGVLLIALASVWPSNKEIEG